MTDRRPPSKLWTDTQRVDVGASRRAATASGVPTALTDEVTGQYEGAELARIRARRPTDERVGRLEEKHDDLDSKVDTIGSKVDVITGKLDVLPELVSALRTAAMGESDRKTLKVTAELDVGKAQAIDVIDGRKARRALIAQIVAAVASVEVIHALLTRLGWL